MNLVLFSRDTIMLQKSIVLLCAVLLSTSVFAQSKKNVSFRTRSTIKISQPLSMGPSSPTTSIPTFSTTKNHIDFVPLDFGQVFPGMSAEKVFTFKGATIGREVGLNVPRGAMIEGAQFSAWVSAPDQITVRYTNNSSTTSNPGGDQTYRVRLK